MDPLLIWIVMLISMTSWIHEKKNMKTIIDPSSFIILIILIINTTFTMNHHQPQKSIPKKKPCGFQCGVWRPRPAERLVTGRAWCGTRHPCGFRGWRNCCGSWTRQRSMPSVSIHLDPVNSLGNPLQSHIISLKSHIISIIIHNFPTKITI